MFSMSSLSGLFKTEYKKCNFEDVQRARGLGQNVCILINTLTGKEQDCLISRTVAMEKEEVVINELLNQGDFTGRCIIVYGRNANDSTVETKYKQLVGLGFCEVYMYMGGMFEWMLLQDIYGSEEFPTTKRVLDILRYK